MKRFASRCGGGLKRFVSRYGVGLGLAVLVSAFFVQGYVARRDLVQASRAVCERSSVTAALDINHIRLDLAGDQAVATSSGVPMKVKRARSLQIARQTQALVIMDSQVDRREWRLFTNSVDRERVRYGTVQRRFYAGRWRRERVPPFDCDTAYPGASLFSLVFN